MYTTTHHSAIAPAGPEKAQEMAFQTKVQGTEQAMKQAAQQEGVLKPPSAQQLGGGGFRIWGLVFCFFFWGGGGEARAMCRSTRDCGKSSAAACISKQEKLRIPQPPELRRHCTF